MYDRVGKVKIWKNLDGKERKKQNEYMFDISCHHHRHHSHQAPTDWGTWIGLTGEQAQLVLVWVLV